VDLRAITKAKSRLRVAEKALGELVSCNQYEAFSDTWYTFLVAAKNVYTVLEQGAKLTARSRQWFGKIKQTRRDDELLQYLFEARNDEDHGLENSTEYVPERIAIGVARPGYSNAIRVKGTIGHGGSLQVESLDASPVFVEKTPPHARLKNVQARGPRIIRPPGTHKGLSLSDNSPISVATLGLSFLAELVEEAEALHNL